MSSFTKTLCFGAVAAASVPLTVLALAGWIGPHHALALHAVAVTAGYLAFLSNGLRRRLAVFAGAALAGGIAWAMAGSTTSLVVLLGLLVAVVRSAILFRGRPARAVAIELAVLAGSLVTAEFLFTPGILGSALAAWGWFVAQSFYFLLGGITPRRREKRGDPFDHARQCLERLLEPAL
jgi:hypothetical protein